jgi:hypothetical protein
VQFRGVIPILARASAIANALARIGLLHAQGIFLSSIAMRYCNTYCCAGEPLLVKTSS